MIVKLSFETSINNSAELNYYSYNGSVTFFDTLSFQVQNGRKHTPFTLTKLNTVHTGVLPYQSKNYEWIASTANSKSRSEGDQELLFEKDS